MQAENNKEIKKIIIVPGNFFVSRNYFSSPLIENLQQISVKEKITIYIAGVESNPIGLEYFKSLKNYFENNVSTINESLIQEEAKILFPNFSKVQDST